MKTLISTLILGAGLVFNSCGDKKKPKCEDFIGVVKSQHSAHNTKSTIYGIGNEYKTIYVYDNRQNEGWLFNIKDSVKIKYWDGFLNIEDYPTDTSREKVSIFWMSTYYSHIKILNNKK